MWKTASHRIKEWLKYQKQSKTKYYLHSPFVFNFYTQIMEAEPDRLDEIENFRRSFLMNKSSIIIDDKGAKNDIYTTSVSYLTKNASTPYKYGKVIYEWLKQNHSFYVIELGTSLGFGTAFMANVRPDMDIITIEASAAVQVEAERLHRSLGLNNIKYINDTFDVALPKVLAEIPRLDFAYIDGNHTEEATLKYFHLLKEKCDENSVLVFDDIYWSEGMTRAWDNIKADKSVTLTIDLYRMGWVFFRKGKLAKEDFILRY
jgi:predicted O-methyltransferase YrrM